MKCIMGTGVDSTRMFCHTKQKINLDYGFTVLYLRLVYREYMYVGMCYFYSILSRLSGAHRHEHPINASMRPRVYRHRRPLSRTLVFRMTIEWIFKFYESTVHSSRLWVGAGRECINNRTGVA